MKITFELPANEHEIFAPDAFDDNVGKKIMVKDIGERTLSDVKVIKDGKSVLLTIDLENDDIRFKPLRRISNR